MADIGEIQNAGYNRKLNILKGFSEVEEIQKAFPQKSTNEPNEEEETDEEEDDLNSLMSGYNENDFEEDDSQNSVSDYAKQTSSEDLKKYIEQNPDGEHVEEAKAELQKRGDLDDNSDSEDFDYSDKELVKTTIENSPDKEKIVQLMLDDPNLTASMALRIHNSSSVDNTELNQKIENVESALADLKTHTSTESEEDDWFDDDYDDGLEDDDENDEEEEDFESDDQETDEEEEEDEEDQDYDDEDEEDEDDEEDFKKKKF